MSDAINGNGSEVVVLESAYGPIAMSVEKLRTALTLARELIATLDLSDCAETGEASVVPMLFDANTSAEILGVHATWLLKRARENRVPHYRIGKYIRFDVTEIRADSRKKSDRHANLEGT